MNFGRTSCSRPGSIFSQSWTASGRTAGWYRGTRSTTASRRFPLAWAWCSRTFEKPFGEVGYVRSLTMYQKEGREHGQENFFEKCNDGNRGGGDRGRSICGRKVFPCESGSRPF